MSSSAPDTSSLRDVLSILNDGGRIRVLHVDDDPDFCDLVALYLEREGDGLEVLTEHSAEAGLERIESGTVDCVVSDYDMPMTNGLEFLQVVRDEHSDLPFILFTGKGSEEIASEAISAGVTDYLQKRGGTEQYSVLANRIENTTRRRFVEREVRRGFRAIETAREGISFLDEHGRFVYANRAYADIYGYDRGALIGEYWKVLYSDEHVDRITEEILPAVPEQGRWTGESIHVRKDGTRLVVDHALAYTDEGTLLCLIQDVTEERETERALERERERFELFVDAVEEYAIFTLDTEGHVTSWNRGAERVKGYDREEIVGEHFSTFYPEEQVEAGRPEELLEAALAEGDVEDRGWRVREDGTEFWADVVITSVFDDEGRHRGFVKVTRDETDRYRTREKTRTAERAVDALEDAFYVLDAEGGIVRTTDRTAAVTGYSREELRAASFPELFDPEDRPGVREGIDRALETGDVRTEADLLTAAGRAVPFELRMARLPDGTGEPSGVACIGRDVHERERRRRQLERQLAQFEHLGGVLAHDLRTPLDTARGRLELARETGDDDHLLAAGTALDRLEELVEDLADVMRKGELVSDLEVVRIEDRVRSAWGSLESTAATLHVEDDGAVRADPEAFKRLIENLLKNALEHGGTDVTVGTLPDGFYVEDDGPGIPESARDRVFEPGYSTKDGGSGFGLASVRQLVVAHGWEIEATEGSTGGARFEITDVDAVG